MAFPSVGFIHAATKGGGRTNEKRYSGKAALSANNTKSRGGAEAERRRAASDGRRDSAALHELGARQEAVHLLLSIAGRNAQIDD